jgi:hypothetical protein
VHLKCYAPLVSESDTVVMRISPPFPLPICSTLLKAALANLPILLAPFKETRSRASMITLPASPCLRVRLIDFSCEGDTLIAILSGSRGILNCSFRLFVETACALRNSCYNQVTRDGNPPRERKGRAEQTRAIARSLLGLLLTVVMLVQTGIEMVVE